MEGASKRDVHVTPHREIVGAFVLAFSVGDSPVVMDVSVEVGAPSLITDTRNIPASSSRMISDREDCGAQLWVSGDFIVPRGGRILFSISS